MRMLCGIPELLSYGRPLGGELVAARAEGVDILRREQVGGLGSRLLDHFLRHCGFSSIGHGRR